MLLKLAVQFPNVFEKIIKCLDLSDAGMVFKVLSLMEPFSTLYDFHAFCIKQVEQRIRDANKHHYLTNHEYETLSKYLLCAKNHEVFTLDRTLHYAAPDEAIKVLRDGILVQEIDIKSLTQPLFNTSNYLCIRLQQLEANFLVIDLVTRKEQYFNGHTEKETLLIPRDYEARKKTLAYRVPPGSPCKCSPTYHINGWAALGYCSPTYHIHGWTLWFIIESTFCPI
jgi:hypothetical protein